MTRRATRRHDHAAPCCAANVGGSTLVEILVAVTLMSSAIMVMVMGMSTLFASSIQNRQSTTAGVVARDYAEALILTVAQTATTDAWCSTTGYTTGYLPPTGYVVSTATLTCPATTAATTPQFQNIAITVTAPLGRTETLNIVVRPT